MSSSQEIRNQSVKVHFTLQISCLFASHVWWKTGEKNIIFLYSKASETTKNLKVNDKFIEAEINFGFCS